MRDPAEILTEWRAGKASPQVKAMLANAAEQLRPRRIEDRPADVAEVRPFTRAELVALTSQIGAGEAIDPALAPRLARMLEDAATGGKRAAALWVPKATTGAVQKAQATAADQRRRINLALHQRVDPGLKMSDEARVHHLRAMWKDYFSNRWPVHGVLISAPPMGPSNADDLFWQLAKLPLKHRILTEKSVSEYRRGLFQKRK